MADYQLAQKGPTVVVSIVGYEGPRLPLLRAFESCEADEVDGRIELQLRPRTGARLDLDDVRRSLESTLTRFDGVSV